MARILRRLFGVTRQSRVRSFNDPVLGELSLSADEDWWESVVTLSGHAIQFQVGGASEPAPQLLAHAHDICRELPAFVSTVAVFLEAQAAAQPRTAAEIRQLTLESVFLPWPDRPNDGMLYFHGPDEFRVWRCDYINRQPVHLGFDS